MKFLSIMKRLFSIGLLSMLLLTLGYAPASAFLFTFDENGNGVFDGTPLLGSLLPDPTNGGALALTYLFPTGVIVGNGTVLVLDPDTTLSHALRFTDSLGRLTALTADRMLFYSELGGNDLADTGFPSNLLSGAQGSPVTVSNGIFTYGISPSIYIGTISEAQAVPEPSSLLLFGAGLLGLPIVRRKFRR